MDKCQFYTKLDVSMDLTKALFSRLWDLVDCPMDKLLFIEPSAWYGCFYDSVQASGWKVVGFDIEPKHENIVEADFLRVDRITPRWAKKNTIAIWNPPFWKRAKLAIDFFNKSANFANTICFIVPNQFSKYSVQAQLDRRYKLVYQKVLNPTSFYVEWGKDYALNSVFQIWTRNKTTQTDRRIREKPATKHPDFQLWQYNNTKEALGVFKNHFDFAVLRQWFGDYNHKVYDEKHCDRKKQRILIKARNKSTLKRLLKIDFEALSMRNTIIPWFGKADLILEYNRLYG